MVRLLVTLRAGDVLSLPGSLEKELIKAGLAVPVGVGPSEYKGNNNDSDTADKRISKGRKSKR